MVEPREGMNRVYKRMGACFISSPLHRFGLLNTESVASSILAMAINSAAVGLLLFFIFSSLLPFSAWGVSSCGGSCRTLDDCEGQLICINGKCDDDPDVGTHICGNSPNTPPPSPTTSTPAILTNNNFEKEGPGTSGPSECDGKYHDNSELIVALSTRWYANGSRCGKMIRITTKKGRSTMAKVVDECDSADGCRNNIVDGSDGVWNALGLDIDIGEVDVTWSMA